MPLACLGNSGYSECNISPEQMEDALAKYAEIFINQSMVGLVNSCSARCQVDIIRPSGCRDSIGEAICKAAERLHAAMVVVPGHRRADLLERIFNPNEHAAYGAYVAKHSGRPTVIFQPPASNEAAESLPSSAQSVDPTAPTAMTV